MHGIGWSEKHLGGGLVSFVLYSWQTIQFQVPIVFGLPTRINPIP